MRPAESLSWVHTGGYAPKPETNPNGLGIGPKKGGKELVTGECLQFDLELRVDFDLYLALEKLSASGVKVPRHASAHEIVWLRDLVAAHGRGEYSNTFNIYF